jgi:23S rRNA (cytidine2498-2'-O)-methyltransferase
VPGGGRPQVSDVFVFALCQTGAEQALKAEIASRQPSWRVAFQRPGLLTFKAPDGAHLALDGLTEAVAPRFGRVCGRSLGLVASPGEAAALVRCAAGEGLVQVSVVEPGRPGEASEARLAEDGALAQAWRVALEAALGVGFQVVDAAQSGQTVFDVVIETARGRDARADDDAPRGALVGCHVAGGVVLPGPGGRVALDLPPEAPSWAWRKCEEALALTGLVPRRGDVALELGAAPGGAVVSLLGRGVAVTAIDPQPMDPRVAAFAVSRGVLLEVIEAPMAEVALESLPRRVDFLLCDAHLAGPVALKGLARYLRWYRESLRALLWTVKLHRWEDAEVVDALLARLGELGMVEVGARQLPSNRQELLVWGRTARGLRGR